MFISSRMSSMITLHLLICMLVFLPLCCGGSKEFILKDGLKINSSNWYRNLGIDELEYYINRVGKSLGKFEHYTEVQYGTISHGQLIESQLSEDGYSVYWSAEIISEASVLISSDKCHLYGGDSCTLCAKNLSKVRLDKTSLGEKCLSMYYNKTACIGMNLKYRSPDGSCNNLKRPYSGKATTAYSRLLFNGYYDCIRTILEGNGRYSLPKARKLSIALINDENSPDDLKTMAMAYWTIFIGHDLSYTAMSGHIKKKKSVRCCDIINNELAPRDLDELCMPVLMDDVTGDLDPFLDFRCMNYRRSVPAVSSDCTFGPREQMNQATHYLDGSMIYGSSAKRTWSLRTKSGGQLITDMVRDNKGQGDSLQPRYMPLEDTESNACQYGTGTCYRAGDTRANTLPQLTVMHTLWVREHNRLAKLLSHVNPHWGDERIFQEARKIVTASIQHITYAEWLPALLGENFTKQNELELLTKGYSNSYNETTDPSVSNTFATAILPFANSMITESINLYTEDRVMNGSLSLKEHYNRPNDLLINYMDQLVRGLSTQNTQKVDILFTRTMTNYLFTVHPDNDFAMDVFSLDVQRNRDHGIRMYWRYREFCGLTPIRNKQDLYQIMMEGSTDILLTQYERWEDIELLVGALLEKHEEDSMVGPTMRCIIKEQFIRTRIADRYFYDLPNVFNEYQLTEIRKVTLARVFCDNSDNVTSMQKQVFLIPTLADLQLCSSKLIPKININHWSEMADTF